MVNIRVLVNFVKLEYASKNNTSTNSISDKWNRD